MSCLEAGHILSNGLKITFLCFPSAAMQSNLKYRQKSNLATVEHRFNEVAEDRPNLFVKSRVRYIENLDVKSSFRA